VHTQCRKFARIEVRPVRQGMKRPPAILPLSSSARLAMIITEVVLEQAVEQHYLDLIASGHICLGIIEHDNAIGIRHRTQNS